MLLVVVNFFLGGGEDGFFGEAKILMNRWFFQFQKGLDKGTDDRK